MFISKLKTKDILMKEYIFILILHFMLKRIFVSRIIISIMKKIYGHLYGHLMQLKN